MPIKELLTKWGLPPEVVQRFVDEGFSEESLLYVTDNSIRALIPKAGPRAAFSYHHERWRKEKDAVNNNLNNNVNDTVNDSVNEDVEDTVPHTVPPVDILKCPPLNCLHEHLQNSDDGRMLLSYYKTHGQFIHGKRDQLAERVILHETSTDNNRRMTRDHFDEIADQIVVVFPTEDKKTWFDIVEKKGRTFVEGRLRHKYYAVRQNYMDCGMIPKCRVTAAQDSDDEFLGVDEYCDNFMWLTNNAEPWVDVVSKWTLSSASRNKFFNTCSSISEYISKFPALKRHDGFELLVMDAEASEPSLKNVDWTPFIDKLASFMKKKIRNFELDDGLSNEEKAVRVLMNLSSLFKVRTIPKSKTASKSSKCWRPSRVEIQEGFLIVVPEVAKIDETLSFIRARHETYSMPLQPVAVLVGTPGRIRQCFVYVNKKKWEIGSPLEAVTVAFKLFFALDAQFPPEARHMWLFLQRVFFGLVKSADFSDDKGLRSYMSVYLKDFENFV